MMMDLHALTNARKESLLEISKKRLFLLTIYIEHSCLKISLDTTFLQAWF